MNLFGSDLGFILDRFDAAIWFYLNDKNQDALYLMVDILATYFMKNDRCLL